VAPILQAQLPATQLNRSSVPFGCECQRALYPRHPGSRSRRARRGDQAGRAVTDYDEVVARAGAGEFGVDAVAPDFQSTAVQGPVVIREADLEPTRCQRLAIGLGQVRRHKFRERFTSGGEVALEPFED